MIFYVTFNDPMSGVFRSQVIDVVNFLNEQLNGNVRLVAFISLRNFRQKRREIKIHLPNAFVLPMFPKISNWKLNKWALKYLLFRLRPEKIIGRSVFATNLAFLARTNSNIKIVYDGRGAIAAEANEYNVFNNEELKNQIAELEKKAVREADFRVAVSRELVKHWSESFQYQSDNHLIIPCTLDAQFSQESRFNQKLKLELGYKADDVLLIYSGSTAGWQSFDLMAGFFNKLLQQKNISVLFLSGQSPLIEKLQSEFPERVKSKKLAFEEVITYLSIGDYGILVREASVTNQVASPVKFAEYLAAGLKVIISPGIGDYSEFVIENNCGFSSIAVPETLPLLTEEDRVHSKALAKRFNKLSHRASYKILLQV